MSHTEQNRTEHNEKEMNKRQVNKWHIATKRLFFFLYTRRAQLDAVECTFGGSVRIELKVPATFMCELQNITPFIYAFHCNGKTNFIVTTKYVIC